MGAARLEKLAQVIEEYLVDHTATWAAWAEADRPKPEVHAIELFYDDVKVKKNAATAALYAIKAASKKRKAVAPPATSSDSDASDASDDSDAASDSDDSGASDDSEASDHSSDSDDSLTRPTRMTRPWRRRKRPHARRRVRLG